MLEESEARARILERTEPLAIETVPLAGAVRRVNRQTLRATVPLPGFDNSAMDGYALSELDCGGTPELTVVGEQAAGRDAGLAVKKGEAIRIFTGAPIPAGTGAVVMQEDVESTGEGRIRIKEAVEVGEFIRRRGRDLCEGQEIVADGQRLTPQHVGLLASQGLATVDVGVQPRIGILTSGDELVPPGSPLSVPGSLYNSNAPMLASLAWQAGSAQVAIGHGPDDPQALAKEAEALLSQGCDVLVLAGGVSVGAHDPVKPMLSLMGAREEFWRVRLKPGKPFLFATIGSTLVFGLPGNPVSAFVSWHTFVAPALARLEGGSDPGPLFIKLRAATKVENSGDRPHYIRGSIGSDGAFAPLGLQQSHALYGLSKANALGRLAAGEVIEAGGEISILPVRSCF